MKRHNQIVFQSWTGRVPFAVYSASSRHGLAAAIIAAMIVKQVAEFCGMATALGEMAVLSAVLTARQVDVYCGMAVAESSKTSPTTFSARDRNTAEMVVQYTNTS